MRYAKSFETPFRRAQWLLRTNGELKFHSLQRLGGLQHGVGVAFHPHLAPQLCELTVAAEQEGRPFDPHIGAAVILFLDPGAERLAHRAILVGGEANGQTAFVAELAEHRDRKSVVSGKSVAVRVDLGGSRCIKKKNNKN